MLLNAIRSRRGCLAHLAFATTILLLVGAAVGCGGNGGRSPEGGTAGGPLVAEAKQMIEEARKPLKFEPPGKSIDAAKLEGRTVAIVSVDQRVPILAAAAEAAREAAEAAGMQATLFDAQAQVNRMLQGMDQAIRRADAMLLLGIPIAIAEDKLRQAQDAEVPAVSVLNNQPEPGEPGQGAGPLVYATSAPDYRKGGALVAAKTIVDTNGGANVEIFTTKEITPASAVVEGMTRMLERCRECEVTMNSTPLAEWATELRQKTQSVILKNPDLNYILPIFDDMAIFITAGIQQAGAAGRVKNASVDGTPAALKLIQNGDVFTADVGQPTAWLGWHAIDQAMRGMLGVEPSDPSIPLRFLDDSNLKGVNVEDLDAPYGKNLGYREGFKQLWGIG